MSGEEKSCTQKGRNWVGTQIVAGLLLSVVTIFLSFRFLPINTAHLGTPADRVIFTIRCLFISSTAVFGVFATVCHLRFNTRAIDPIRGGGEGIVAIHNRVLNNTTEQFLFHAVAMLTLSTFLDGPSMKLIPILAVLFVLARLLFWWGYMRSPFDRALGMCCTMAPTLFSYVYCFYCIIRNVFLSSFVNLDVL